MSDHGYYVTWHMHIEEDEASTPGEAAECALAYLRNPHSEAAIFDVDRVLSTFPSDGRPWQFEGCGMFDGETGEPPA